MCVVYEWVTTLEYIRLIIDEYKITIYIYYYTLVKLINERAQNIFFSTPTPPARSYTPII
ncbi:hypothetical protein Mmah_1116 [Methanohalophilus mahii DSM 5219]|uniref:Uncharacterized protein n=1 Tax=Methanohalophilus mahii (strain ATCC 35705 / DSM 5219 / SLP) TaxID=547558 RepID=D5EBS2_METMS|nr:hypothetical protein Mmah_1116 [Methanohalophilus mahii DSM 5219]